MVKKLACFTMIVALLCSLTGCADSAKNQEAYDLFMQSAQSVNEQDGRYLNVFGMLTTEYNDQKSFMSMSGYYMQQVQDGKKLVDAIFSVSDTTSEEPTEYNYVTDGDRYAYVLDNEMTEMTEADFSQATGYGTLVTAFEADAVKSVEVGQPDESSTYTTYTMKLDKKKTADLAAKLLESINLINTAQVPVEFKNSEVTAKIVVDAEGKPVSFGYTLKTDATAEGETMGISYNATFTVYQTGDEVQVNVTDLGSYLDAQASSSETESSSEESSAAE